MKKVFYIGHVSDPDDSKMRKAAPAADTKSDYIISKIKDLGYDVEILSWCSPEERNRVLTKHKGYVTQINNTKVRFFNSYDSKFRVLRVIGRYLAWLERKKFIEENCLDDEKTLVIYHSLAFIKLLKYLSRKNKKFILEMEEIYSDVVGKTSYRQTEIDVAKNAVGYIFPTQYLEESINPENKPSVIVHGTYRVEPSRNIRLFDPNYIHCVYAGTFDPRKGCCAAAAAAEFLPENYHVHIIGFGNKEDTENIKRTVKEVAGKSSAKVSFDGLYTGEEYIVFIQNCDIGLSTQDPDAAFNSTSFPSKTLSYLSNGIKVVSIRIPAIEHSKVGKYLSYYEEQTPEKIAQAIMSVNLSDDQDSRKIVEKLDAECLEKMKIVLES